MEKYSRLNVLGEQGQGAAPSCAQKTQLAGSADGLLRAGAGFGGNVAMVTLGCAKNLVDSEIMLGVLLKKGFRPVGTPEDADLIVVNTCAFLQSAVEEGIDKILELSEYKQTARCRRLIVAGCMVERYRAQLEQSLPEVDRFISTDELLLVGEEESTTAQCFNEARRPYFIYDEAMPRLRSTGGHLAYVKVSEGCNRPCSFCIIPKIRGAFRSRSVESVTGEVKNLLSEGVKEIVFVAQDLTAYGSDWTSAGKAQMGNKELVKLLRTIDSQTKDFAPYWLRLLYAYPVGVNEELISTILELPNLSKYLDCPLQHISNAVLKNMRRPLGEKGTRALVEKVREIAPQLALRTTFIVGFPGETEADVAVLESFIAEGHFTHLGVFSYSQESEAASYSYPNQLADEVKEERRQRLMLAQQEVVQRRLKALVGSEQRVLLEGDASSVDPSERTYQGQALALARAEWQGPETDGDILITDFAEEIDFTSNGNSLSAQAHNREVSSWKGRFGVARITGHEGYDLLGRLVAIRD